MKVLFTPQLNEEFKYIYTFDGDIVTVTHSVTGVVEQFDFSGLPDGEMPRSIDDTIEDSVIKKAEKINGVLYLTLLYNVGKDATREELFPEWRDI